jgi:hypothetical protein
MAHFADCARASDDRIGVGIPGDFPDQALRAAADSLFGLETFPVRVREFLNRARANG